MFRLFFYKEIFKLWPIKVFIYEDCAESIQPFWISREPVALACCNSTASQRRPYCDSVNIHAPVGLVGRRWDVVDWACVTWPSNSQISSLSKAILALGKAKVAGSHWLSLCTVWLSHSQWPNEQIREYASMRLPILQFLCRLFWQSITLPKSVSPPTAQIWFPATSGFCQSRNHLWKGGDLSIRRSYYTSSVNCVSPPTD